MLKLIQRLRKFLDRHMRENPASPAMGFLRGLRFLTQVGIEFYQERCFYMASTLSFSSAFALVPVSTVYFSVFNAFPDFNSLVLKAREAFLLQMVPESHMRSEVVSYLNELTSHVYLAGVAVFAAYTDKQSVSSAQFKAAAAALDSNSVELSKAVGSVSTTKDQATFLHTPPITHEGKPCHYMASADPSSG